VPLETATYISALVVTNPDGGDARSTIDDHTRLLKAVLKRTFPLVDGAISLSSVQYMYLNDLSASVQLQLNQLRDGSATANNAVNARYANSASLALYANSASFATLAATANSASYAALAGTATLALTANSASYAVLAGRASTADSASYAVLAGSASAATTAVFATSASSAALLSGIALSDVSANSTVVMRSGTGHIFVNNVHQGSENNDPDVVAQVMFTNGTDGYLRKKGISNFGTVVSGQNITGRTGTTKTLSSSSPSGGSNGDLWYQI
jgi:hypothetical protein